jgi:hypothetical protein
MDSKKRPLPLPEQRPESRVAVPLNVQLEVAKQNQRLAELRYKARIRRGRAWQVEREGKHPT